MPIPVLKSGRPCCWERRAASSHGNDVPKTVLTKAVLTKAVLTKAVLTWNKPGEVCPEPMA